MIKKIKSKGFTLIELLAVITIIGIVALITVPVVTDIIERTNTKVFTSNEKLMAISAENYYKLYPKELPSEVSGVTTVNLETLIQEGLIKVVRNPEDNTLLCGGYVVVTKTTENIFDYNSYLECGTDDFTSNGYSSSPVIVLKGSSSINIIQGSTYIDAGAIAYDDLDGDITSKISVTNDVNTSTVGTYTVSYNVIDSEYNTTTATRTVNVIP